MERKRLLIITNPLGNIFTMTTEKSSFICVVAYAKLGLKPHLNKSLIWGSDRFALVQLARGFPTFFTPKQLNNISAN